MHSNIKFNLCIVGFLPECVGVQLRVFVCLRVCRYVASRDAAQEAGEIGAEAGMR